MLKKEENATEVKTLFYDSKILKIPLSKIEVERITGEIEEEHIVTLANSIRKNGMIEPLLLRKKPGSSNYVLVCGTTRYLALCFLRATHAPAVVLSLTNAEAGLIPLIRKQTNRELNAFEEARLLAFLLQNGRFQKHELSDALDLSIREIERRLQLLRLTQKQQNFLLGRHFSTEFAYLLTELPAEKRQELLTKILLENMKEPAARALLQPEKNPPEKTVRPVGKVCGVFGEQLVLNSMNRIAAQINQSGGKASVITAVSDTGTEYRLVVQNKRTSTAI